MTTLTATQARSDFFNVIEKARHHGMPITITVDGEPRIVMMSAEEFEGWMETLDIMSDEKAMRDIRRYEKDKKEGKVKMVTLDHILHQVQKRKDHARQSLNNMWNIVFHPQASKALLKIPDSYQRRILGTIEALAENPFRGKKLQGILDRSYTLRVWPYRIIYKVHKKEITIVIMSIGHRQGVYN